MADDGWSDEHVTLSTLKEGALEEIYQKLWRQCLDSWENIDIDPEAPREITLKLVAKQDPNTGNIVVILSGKPKIPGEIVAEGAAVLTHDRRGTRQYVGKQKSFADVADIKDRRK